MDCNNIIRQLVFVLFLHIAACQYYTEQCDRATMTLRAGYKEHPTDCSKYIQCHMTTNGRLEGAERQCAYGTYWNPTYLTCIYSSETVCRKDMCYMAENGRTRQDDRNCRGYWECRNNVSIPRCCPLGQNFKDKFGCVDNTGNETCFVRCLDSLPSTTSKPNTTASYTTKAAIMPPSSHNKNGKNFNFILDRLNSKPQTIGAISTRNTVLNNQKSNINDIQHKNQRTFQTTVTDKVNRAIDERANFGSVNSERKNTHSKAQQSVDKPFVDGQAIVRHTVTTLLPSTDASTEPATTPQATTSQPTSTSPVSQTAAAYDFCNKQTVPGEPNMYLETMHSGTWTVVRPCPTGTIFFQSVCNCFPIWNPPTVTESPTQTGSQTTTCTPHIHLPFTTDHRDESGNGHDIVNENVSIENGTAVFSGKDSRLIIPNFVNLGFTNSLVIKVVYTSDAKKVPPNRQMTIFSNDGCNKAPTVFMYENSEDIMAGIGTQAPEGAIETANTISNSLTPKREVMYMFHAGEFTVKEGVHARTVPVRGEVDVIQCPLYIGYGADMMPFTGEIDSFTVYICRDDAVR